MARAYRVERYRYKPNSAATSRRIFVDVYYHTDGSILHNVRPPVDLPFDPLNYNMTKVRFISKQPVCQWARSKQGVIREHLRNKANTQEKAYAPTQQGRWTIWSKMFDEKPERFILCAVVENGKGKYVKEAKA